MCNVINWLHLTTKQNFLLSASTQLLLFPTFTNSRPLHYVLQGPVGMAPIMIRILRKLFHPTTYSPKQQATHRHQWRFCTGQLLHWQKLAKMDVKKQILTKMGRSRIRICLPSTGYGLHVSRYATGDPILSAVCEVCGIIESVARRSDTSGDGFRSLITICCSSQPSSARHL